MCCSLRNGSGSSKGLKSDQKEQICSVLGLPVWTPRSRVNDGCFRLEGGEDSQCLLAVSVFRTGDRGDRLVPRYPRGPQNLFDRHRSAELITYLRHWILGGTYNNFAPVAPYCQNPPLFLGKYRDELM
ncbi:hypothetical protein AVEN_222768-1 [Araneus ventricosus]|uniref:Uncharacterized protein n=1 Tax=Araneus ventricosus TaxID=182803 RepID=A0A4Y2B201_ARAVE|nr:hypothetical protein AVEN_222768-1 [Araneus ventricosus]